MQADLREKAKQLQAVSAELSMHQAQAAEYKCKIEQLSAGIGEVKSQWFAQKRREQQQQHAEFAAKGPIALSCAEGVATLTLSGGFAMTAAV